MHTKFLQTQLLTLWILLASTVSFAGANVFQEQHVSGKVVTVDKEPIPGVNIIQKGTTIGTVTDAEGNFSLQAPASAVLIFSAIGFETKEVPIGNQRIINVELREDLTSLEEVVVTGYGEQKRSNLTGALSSVKGDQLENKSQLRLDQALQGMAAGVTVARNGGAPGERPTIHIRGAGSISNSEPLWIVDGMRMDPGNQFDIDDVESIEVLKDGSSAAIYGAQAAHGVILVTTKRGKGGLTVNFKTSLSKRSPVRLPTLLNSADFVKYKKESRLNAGQNPEPSWDDYEHDTDWVDAFYAGSGLLTSYDLSVSKGDDKSNFYLSFGHDNEDGILIDNSFKRYSLRINSDVSLTKWLKLGESFLLSRVDENPIGNNNENYTGGIPYRSIPIMPIYDPENKYGGWGRAPVYFQGPNPVATQYQQHEDRNYNRIDGNIYLEAAPIKGLTVRGGFGYNFMSYMGEKFDEAFDYGAFADPINSLTFSAANDLTMIGNIVATYSKKINDHNFSVLGGYEALKGDSKHFNVARTNSPVDYARSFNILNGAASNTDRYNIYQRRILSFFGRVNYNFKERYLFEANFRSDASAPKFGPSNIWGFFPSLSAGWRISDEAFFANVPYITNLKLRVSAGKLGSDAIGDFIYLKTYTSQFSTYAFDNKGANPVAGYFISKFPNYDVKWEEINTMDIGVDINAFQSKFSLALDYYIKDTKDLLYEVPIPSSVGISVHNFNPVNPALNIGTMRNTGFDIELGYKENFHKWTSNFSMNMSFMKNEMKSLAEGTITGGNGGGQIGGMTRTEAGRPISSFYGYIVQQMLNTPGDVYAINTYPGDGIYQEAGTAPGDFMYKDISGPNGVPDGDITTHDRTFLGNPWPKMTYALNANLVYNNMIDFSIQFQGVQGVDIFNANKAYTRNFFGDNNTTTDIYEAWTPENHTQHPRNIASDPNGNWSKPSSYFIEDGSYLKIRNIQIGFTLPQQTVSKIGLKRTRIFVNGNNLLTITKYSGFDPEIAGSNTSRGVDYGYYPQVRTYTAGLEIQF